MCATDSMEECTTSGVIQDERDRLVITSLLRCPCLYPAPSSPFTNKTPHRICRHLSSTFVCGESFFPSPSHACFHSSFPGTCTVLEPRAKRMYIVLYSKKLFVRSQSQYFGPLNVLSIRPCTSMNKGSSSQSRILTKSVTSPHSISSLVRYPTSCSYPLLCLPSHTDTDFLQTMQCPAGLDQPCLRPSFCLIDNLDNRWAFMIWYVLRTSIVAIPIYQ